MNTPKADDHVTVLKGCPVFAGVSQQWLNKLAANCVFATHEPGELVVSHQDRTDDVFVMLSGVARVIIYSAGGRAVNFGRIRRDQVFGEFAAIDGFARSAAVEAVERCQTFRMTPACLWELIDAEPAFRRWMLRHLAGVARTLTARIFEFSTLPVGSRVQAELLRLVRQAGNGSGEAAGVLILPTHAEIAERISTHREAVARELSRLSGMGVIERRGKALLVKDVGRLEQMIRDANSE